ncbi:EAL domain-containing protein [Thalassotalea aquiviva]|uniref:EAL domain-containing protein n=1 Tax=Thalassotalea aquiviva TaxID=3242415 RepID=UPI00352B8976
MSKEFIAPELEAKISPKLSKSALILKNDLLEKIQNLDKQLLYDTSQQQNPETVGTEYSLKFDPDVMALYQQILNSEQRLGRYHTAYVLYHLGRLSFKIQSDNTKLIYEEALNLIAPNDSNALVELYLFILEEHLVHLYTEQRYFGIYQWSKKGIEACENAKGKSAYTEHYISGLQNSLATAYLKLNLTDQAIELLNHIIATQPENHLSAIFAQSILARTYVQSGNTEQGYQEFQKAIAKIFLNKDFNNTALLGVDFSQTLWEFGEEELAIQVNKQILSYLSNGESLPLMSPYYKAKWLYWQSFLSYSQRDWPAFKRHYDQLQPYFSRVEREHAANIFQYLALYYEQLGNTNKALQAIERSIMKHFRLANFDLDKLNPADSLSANSAGILKTYARLIEAQGRINEANDVLSNATQVLLYQNKVVAQQAAKNALRRNQVLSNEREARRKDKEAFAMQQRRVYAISTIVVFVILTTAIVYYFYRRKEYYQRLSLLDFVTQLPNFKKLEQDYQHNTHGSRICYINIKGHNFHGDLLSQQKLQQKAAVFSDVINQVIGPDQVYVYYLGGNNYALLIEGHPLTSKQLTIFSSDIQHAFNQAIYPGASTQVLWLKFVWSPCLINHKPKFKPLTSDLSFVLYGPEFTAENNIFELDQALSQTVSTRRGLQKKLSQSSRQDYLDFSLVFQPKYDVVNQRFYGAETLLRWHPNGQPIGPNIFIPIMEQSGLMVSAGEWVIRQALANFQRLNVDHNDDFVVSINVSPRQLVDVERFVSYLKQQLIVNKVRPHQVELEITEEAQFHNQDLALDAIKALGCRVSIDDFGSGYASINYLLDEKYHCAKVDRSLTSQVLCSSGYNVLLSIFTLFESLQLDSVVEGVETEAELKQLVSLGFTHFQGYYFAKPMTINDFIDFCQQHQKPA